MRALLLIAMLIPAAAAAEPTPLTYTTPLTPTGEVLAPGHAEMIQGATILHHDVAIGVTRGLELRLGMPIVPLPIMGGDLQVRAAVLPETSRLRVVIGAGVLAEWINGADAWPAASATVAWRGDRWNVHATARIADHAGDDGDRALWNTIGASWRVGARTTLFAEVGQLAWTAPGDTCIDKHGASSTCMGRDAIDGVAIGAWWQLPRLSVGLFGVLAHHEDTVLPILPLLSIRHERDL